MMRVVILFVVVASVLAAQKNLIRLKNDGNSTTSPKLFNEKITGAEQPLKKARIIGGEDTSVEEYPFVGVALWDFWGFLFHTCGGTLITRNAVVSAAHCLTRPAESYRFRFGGTLVATTGVDHFVTRYTRHELYSAYDYDVSVAHLSVSVTISPQIGVARLPTSNYVLNTDDVVTMLGWGLLTPTGPSAELLQRVEVNVIDQDICYYRYRLLQSQPWEAFPQTVTPRMMCTGILDVGGKDACAGDFGGPVIHNGDVLVGIITSWGGKECGSATYPRVNARVSVLSEWIQKHAVAV